ncbi:MAG: hypothetical protein QG650_739, partial [Patescibacteria group bacterium]|nr:hypothetical protein [Patescibacteria group bacterium]
EVARGRSIGFTETIFATLSYAIHHLESSGDAETEAASGISEKSVIDLAWTLSLTPRSGNTIAQGIRNSLSDCPNPIAYFSEPFTAESGLDVRNLKRWEVDIARLS